MKSRITFEQWIELVDQWLLGHVGLGHDDLPDCPYYVWYMDRLPPATAGKRARRYADGY